MASKGNPLIWPNGEVLLIAVALLCETKRLNLKFYYIIYKYFFSSQSASRNLEYNIGTLLTLKTNNGVYILVVHKLPYHVRW